jgi:hypothetical protein
MGDVKGIMKMKHIEIQAKDVHYGDVVFLFPNSVSPVKIDFIGKKESGKIALVGEGLVTRLREGGLFEASCLVRRRLMSLCSQKETREETER